MKNAIVLIGVVVFAVLIFVGMEYLDNNGRKSDSSTDSNTNYQTLATSIDSFTQQQWNKTQYYQLKNNIGRSQIKLINKEQGQKLQALLDAKYLKQMAEEAERICSSSMDIFIATSIREELKKLQGNGIDDAIASPLDNIKKFIWAYDMKRQIGEYKKEAYSYSRTSKFFRDLTYLEQHELLSQNSSLLKTFVPLRSKLSKQKAFDNRDLSKGSCRLYNGYDYYFDKCNCIQTGNKGC